MMQSGDISRPAVVPGGGFVANGALHSESARHVPHPASGNVSDSTDTATRNAPGEGYPPVDTVMLSREGVRRSAAADGDEARTSAEASQSRRTSRQTGDGEALSQDELRMIEELRARDREVRAHEAAHLANAGQYARGGASFTYQQGPDGRRYAVGGEVGIDSGKEQDPEATIRKMQTVRRAALAPANPSATDRAVAAAAAATQAEAQRELQRENGEDDDGSEASQGAGTEDARAIDAGTSTSDDLPPGVSRRGQYGAAAGQSPLSLYA